MSSNIEKLRRQVSESDQLLVASMESKMKYKSHEWFRFVDLYRNWKLSAERNRQRFEDCGRDLLKFYPFDTETNPREAAYLKKRYDEAVANPKVLEYYFGSEVLNDFRKNLVTFLEFFCAKFTEEKFDVSGMTFRLLKKVFKDVFDINISSINDVGIFIDKLNERRDGESLINDEQLKEFADKFVEWKERQEERVQELFTKTISEFTLRARRLVQEDILPTSVIANLNRLLNVKIYIKERFLPHLPHSFERDTIGVSENLGDVSVYSNMLNPEDEVYLIGVMTHELMHEISGLAIKTDPTRSSTRRKGLLVEAGYSRYKVGIRTHGTLNDGRWLNEASTVRLNNLFNYKDDAYEDERIVLDELISAGLDEKLLWEAYFENWADNGQGKMDPSKSKYRELIDQINNLLNKVTGEKYNWSELCKRLG